MHYLVTGGGGFIGSHIVEELLLRGQRVRVLDNFSTGRRENLAFPGMAARQNLEVVEGDICDAAGVRSAMRGIDFVLHEAALASVQRSIDDPLATNEVNVRGTLNVLLAARGAGVKRLVFASSSSVYGDSVASPKREDLPANPLSPYAVSKLAGERYCIAFHLAYKLPAVCIRYFNVFGPRQDPNSQYSAVIPRFITALLKGKPSTIFGDGLQSRDFTYVSNVVHANILACTCNEAIGRVLNVACGEEHSLLQLHEELSRIIGAKASPSFEPARTGDVRHSRAATGLARSLLGYSPVIGWEEGLLKTVEYYQRGGRAAPM
ncbi:SDR family oxidoreductase [bacterium]|nr:MAG: SDR family oxidoreductase [bacterium]